MLGLHNYLLVIFEIADLRMHLLDQLVFFLNNFGQALDFGLQRICVLFGMIQLFSQILVGLFE